MSIRNQAAIVAIGETPTDRLGSKPGEPRKSSAEYFAAAMHLALEDAGSELERIFKARASASQSPPHIRNRFGPKKLPKFSASRPDFFSAAPPAAPAQCRCSAACLPRSTRGSSISRWWSARRRPFPSTSGGGIQPGDMRDWEIPYGTMGPNSKIAMVMRRYMHEYGATLDHFGKIAVAGRYHASLNPFAYLRKPITVQDYKESRLVADPVRLLDCVMPANGGRAYIVHLPERAKSLRKKPIYLKGFGERSNPSYGPRAGSDALVMGVKDAGKVALEMAGVKHSEINFLAALRRLHHRSLLADRRSRLLRQGRSRVFTSGPISPSKDNCRFKPAAA